VGYGAFSTPKEKRGGGNSTSCPAFRPLFASIVPSMPIIYRNQFPLAPKSKSQNVAKATKRECVCFDVYAASDNEITQMEEDYPSNRKWNIWVIVCGFVNLFV